MARLDAPQASHPGTSTPFADPFSNAYSDYDWENPEGVGGKGDDDDVDDIPAPGGGGGGEETKV